MEHTGCKVRPNGGNLSQTNRWADVHGTFFILKLALEQSRRQ